MSSYKLYTPEASFRAFAILIAAQYNGISLEIDTNLENASKSPTGKLPLLETSEGDMVAFSSHAAARYLAGVRRDTGLVGSNLKESAAVDMWMDWAAQELELPACVWFYPVAGYMPFNQEAYEKAKTDFAAALKKLNDHLTSASASDFLVNDQITLADIVVASTLVYPFKLVADKAYLKPYPKVVEWFQTVVNQAECQQVIGAVTMCQKELKAATATGQQ